jgi:hypothetical protein
MSLLLLSQVTEHANMVSHSEAGVDEHGVGQVGLEKEKVQE